MLHVVRRNKNSIVIWAILGVVVFVFVFWGVEAVVSGPGVNAVASVGDTMIEPLEVQRAEFNLVQAYRNAYQDQFTPEVRQSLNLRQRALDGLIERAVLAAQAQKMGIAISDGELRDVILGNPAFQRDGRFDKDAYVRVLRASRLTPAAYEESRREDLAIQRLQQVVEDGVSVGPQEVRDALRSEMETRTFRFVKVPTSEFEAEVDVDDEEALAATYEENKARYASPERARAALVVFSADRFVDEVEVPEEDVTALYDDNREARFTQPREVSARHILIKTEAGADDEAKAAARGRLEEIQKKVAAGEDFAGLATEFSEDTGSAAKGGDLGYFGKGRMVPAFEAVAFELEPGQTSEIVESPFGFHLIRVEDVREERVQTLDEVREEILAELQGERGGEKAEEAARAASAALAEGKTLDEVAGQYELTVTTPEPFAQNEVIPGVGRSFPLSRSLASLEPGGYTEPTSVEGDWVIARLEEKIPSAIPPLEEVRARVVGDLRRAEGEKKSKAAAAELLARARELGSLEAAAEAVGRTVETSASVARPGPSVAGMGVNPGLKDAVFGLSEERPLADETFTYLGDALVVGLGEIDAPTDEEVDEKLEDARAALLAQSRQALFQRYLEELKAAAHVQVNTTLLEQLPPV